MNIYEKLQMCRVALQKAKIKKSGKNTYSGYDYFELSDFLPTINELFMENRLCSQVSFDNTIATLTITDIDKPEDKITFTSPMADAQLKGCHPIQNLGAVETYSRRYLYMAAMEITEPDILEPHDNNAEIKHTCTDCGKEITATAKKTVDEIIEGSKKYYKTELCQACVSKRYTASKGAK